MVRLRKTRMTAYLACILILLMQIGPATQAWAAKAPLVPKQRILVMPFSTGESVITPGLGDKVGHTLSALLRDTPGYEVVDYSKRHPSLQRAVLVEMTITEKDLVDPSGTANADIATKIAKEMGVDFVIVGDVDVYTYDAANNTCSVQMTAQMVPLRGGSLQPVIVTGEVPQTAKVANETDCAGVAAGDAVKKIVDGLKLKPSSAIAMTTPSADQPRKKSKKSSIWLSLLLGLGIGLAMSGGDSGGSGDGGGGFEPPPPVPQ